MRDTILELADQRQARSLLTAFSIKDSLKNGCPFPLQRNPARGYLPVTFTQITWFVITEFAVILLGDLPPLSLIEGAFLKYFGIPVALTWFMSQKTFDGKKPYSFLKSQITFALRPKVTYAGKAVKLEKKVFSEPVTAVRSVMYVPD